MSSGKHSSNEPSGVDVQFSDIKAKKVAKIIIVILAVINLIACSILVMKTIKNNNGGTVPTTTNTVDNNQEITTMPNKIKDYKVLGKLVIEKIEVEKYILEKTNEEALKLGVTKLYGPSSVNQLGNLCIAGHNYADVFLDLTALEKEDTFYIEDTKGNKVTYKIYDKYSVEPDDLNCLMPNEKEKEVTLVTCETGALTRLVIKAKELKVEDKKAKDEKTNTVNENKNTTNTAINENKVTEE